MFERKPRGSGLSAARFPRNFQGKAWLLANCPDPKFRDPARAVQLAKNGAAGLALAKRLKSESGRVFCLTSDGEWNEGSCWEALIFAQHHHPPMIGYRFFLTADVTGECNVPNHENPRPRARSV